MQKIKLHRTGAAQELAEHQTLRMSNEACYKMRGQSKLIYLQIAVRVAYQKPPHTQSFQLTACQAVVFCVIYFMSCSEDERYASPQSVKNFLFLMRMVWRIYINFALMIQDQAFVPPLKGSEAKWKRQQQISELLMMTTLFLVASQQFLSFLQKSARSIKLFAIISFPNIDGRLLQPVLQKCRMNCEAKSLIHSLQLQRTHCSQ